MNVTEAERLCRKARTLLEGRRASEAVPLLERAAALAPRSTVPLCLAAVAHQSLSGFKDARRCAERALILDPENEWAYALLRTSVHFLGSVSGPGATATGVTPLSAGNPLVLYNLARLQLQRGRTKDCETTYKTLAALAPEHRFTYEIAALLAAQKKRWREAEEKWRGALSFNPEEARYHHHVGLSLLNQNKVRESIQYFERALLLDPAQPKARSNAVAALARFVAVHSADAAVAALFGVSLFWMISTGELDLELARVGVHDRLLAARGILASTIGYCLWRVFRFRNARRELSGFMADLQRTDARLFRLAILVGSPFGLVLRLVLAALLSLAVANWLLKYSRLGWLVMAAPLWLGVKGVRGYQELQRARKKAGEGPRVGLLGRTRRDLTLRLTWLAMVCACAALVRGWGILLVPAVAALLTFGYRFLFDYDDFEL